MMQANLGPLMKLVGDGRKLADNGTSVLQARGGFRIVYAKMQVSYDSACEFIVSTAPLAHFPLASI